MSTNALKAVATGKSDNPIATFHSFLEARKSQIAAALPKHLTPERMMRLALTEFTKTPALQKCTLNTIYASIIQASQLGLEIGVAGQAYLVPFFNSKTGKTDCQLIPGYKGLIALARRSGDVTSITTHIVYERDTFDLVLGLNENIVHKPYLEGDRGTPKLVYGVATFKDGGHHFEWMPMSEVNKIRDRSKASKSGPWVTDYEQMARKTLIRRMVNYLPMSIELQNALNLSDAADNGQRVDLDGMTIDMETGEVPPPAGDVTTIENEAPKRDVPDAAEPQAPRLTYASLMDRIAKAADVDVLDADATLIDASNFPDAQQRAEMVTAYKARRKALLGE